MPTTLIENARVWQWTPARAALLSPSAMLEAAERGALAAPYASWMLIDDDSGKILAVGGSDAAATATAGGSDAAAAATRRVDMGGRLVLPGLCDAHIHCYMLGLTSAQVNLEACGSLEAMRAAGRADAFCPALLAAAR